MDTRKLVLKVVRGGRGRLVTRDAIADEFLARGADLARLDVALASLVKAGTVTEVQPGGYVALRTRNLVIGRLNMTRSGYGFVDAPGVSVHISAKHLHGAWHHDTVAVRLEEQRRGQRGASGEVAYVVERGLTSVVGRFERAGKVGVVVPSDRRIRGDVFISSGESMDAAYGDMVVVRITGYPSEREMARGVIEEVLGPADAPGVDIEVIIREHGLRWTFPGETLAAAESIPLTLDEEVERVGHDVLWEGRKDLRDLFTITIDPVDARDFDDAISLVREAEGWRLWVHIADVSHYVPWNSPIDEEAQLRATSVYLVDRVLPMLPERLSNGICSLNPGVERLAMTAEMLIDTRGEFIETRFYPAVIRSDQRLDYDGVDAMLSTGEGFPDQATEGLLREFAPLADRLRQRRERRGGLDLETVEAKVWLDTDGHPTHITLRERTVATNMIEEAMIRANEAVAEHLVAAHSPMVFRVHEDPDPDGLAQVAVILKEFDYPITDVRGASPATFQRIIRFAHTRPERLLINSLLLRSLKRARYSDELAGHFGLASEAYCHFTSPIRRYPDLIVHRLLKAQLTGTLATGDAAVMAGQLASLAEHSSLMEREADMAERDSVKMKLCELMTAHIGETFDGTIVSVSSFGMFVQLGNTAEGLVHVETMTDDWYRYEAERFMLIGDHNGLTHRLGDKVRVRIIDVSVSEMRIDMELA